MLRGIRFHEHETRIFFLCSLTQNFGEECAINSSTQHHRPPTDTVDGPGRCWCNRPCVEREANQCVGAHAFGIFVLGESQSLDGQTDTSNEAPSFTSSSLDRTQTMRHTEHNFTNHFMCMPLTVDCSGSEGRPAPPCRCHPWGKDYAGI